MQHVLFKGKKICYSISGKGKVVVLIHGFCEDSRMWDEFHSEIDGYKTVRIDLPGFGKSEFIEDLSIELMAECVYNLMNQLGINHYSIIGHSMGGYIGLAFAEKYPNLLDSLVLFHSHPFEDDEEKKAIRKRSISFIEDNGHVLYVKQLIPTLVSPDYTNELLINRLIYNACAYKDIAITSALKAMMVRPDRSHVLESINCPILFIIGKMDQAITFSQSLKQTQYPKIAQIEVLNKVGHMGMFESPKETSRIIRKFLAFCNAKS